MNRITSIRDRLVLPAVVSILVVVSGCSGDGVGDLIKTPGSGGTGTGEQVFSVGPIHSIAPLEVNSIRFETAAMTIVDEMGRVIDGSGLNPGMVVELNGQFSAATVDANPLFASESFDVPDTLFSSDSMFWTELENGAPVTKDGRADYVRLKSQARGQVELLTTTGFTIGGLSVRVDSSSKVSETVEIEVGQWVEVFGLADPTDGTVIATLIRSALPGQIKTTGMVSNLNRVEGELSVNGNDFDFSSLVETLQMSIANGDNIQIFATDERIADRFMVTEIRPASRRLPETGSVSLEGIVGDYQSLAEFSVQGTLVNATAARMSTVSGEAASANRVTVQNGYRVQVIGRVNQGVIVANEVNVVATNPGVNVIVGGG